MVFIYVTSTNLNNIDFRYVTNNNQKYRQLFVIAKFLFLSVPILVSRIQVIILKGEN